MRTFYKLLGTVIHIIYETLEYKSSLNFN